MKVGLHKRFSYRWGPRQSRSSFHCWFLHTVGFHQEFWRCVVCVRSCRNMSEVEERGDWIEQDELTKKTHLSLYANISDVAQKQMICLLCFASVDSNTTNLFDDFIKAPPGTVWRIQCCMWSHFLVIEDGCYIYLYLFLSTRESISAISCRPMWKNEDLFKKAAFWKDSMNVRGKIMRSLSGVKAFLQSQDEWMN